LSGDFESGVDVGGSSPLSFALHPLPCLGTSDKWTVRKSQPAQEMQLEYESRVSGGKKSQLIGMVTESESESEQSVARRVDTHARVLYPKKNKMIRLPDPRTIIITTK
jgi:hypothetical protein